jgi:hypothetical protein
MMILAEKLSLILLIDLKGMTAAVFPFEQFIPGRAKTVHKRVLSAAMSHAQHVPVMRTLRGTKRKAEAP